MSDEVEELFDQAYDAAFENPYDSGLPRLKLAVIAVLKWIQEHRKEGCICNGCMRSFIEELENQP